MPLKAMVVVPTYNERDNVERLIGEVLAQDEGIEVLVVDDNSPDGTGEVVERMKEGNPRLHLLRRPGKLGLGSAYRDGFRFALTRGVDYIIEMDADFSHQPSYIPYFLGQMEDCDLLIGSRLVQGGGERGRHLLRKWITRLANSYIRVILGLPFRDCTSGYRVFRREVLRAIELDQIMSMGPSVVEEVLYKAYRRGFRIKEAPYILEERMAGESTFNRKIMLNALKMILKIRWRYRNYPERS